MPSATSELQDEVISFLSKAETFGGERVVQIETHASIVSLAGDKAYKLKKALRYSYLDYSTIERRRSACEAEFAINSRFAPELYLGVQPIARLATGALELNGDGDAVDWVVVMRRFDQASQFDRMAERRELPIELMRPLADRIAEVHGAVEIRSQYGGLAGLRGAIDITIENLRLAIDQGLSGDEVELWTTATLQSLSVLAPVLERRRLAGRVRACHGDLHLQNICLFEGRPVLFDAIEFDESISSTDILYDLAFLLMDLHHRRLEAHANVVFNRYLDRRDESDGLAALPLFMSVRAAIRAQVSAAAARHGHDAEKTTDLMAQSRSYLGMALKIVRSTSPRLVAVGGLSGTGKSTLAYRLAPLLDSVPGARVLRSDMVRKRTVGVAPEQPLPAASYTRAMHCDTYRRMLTEARACIEAGRSVVIDAVYANQDERLALATLAQAIGCPFQGLWLEAPIKCLEWRIVGRRHDASDAGIDILRAQIAHVDKPMDWLGIDATGSPATVAAAALKSLDLPSGT